MIRTARITRVMSLSRPYQRAVRMVHSELRAHTKGCMMRSHLSAGLRSRDFLFRLLSGLVTDYRSLRRCKNP